jgi:hypothetical protein
MGQCPKRTKQETRELEQWLKRREKDKQPKGDSGQEETEIL